MSEVSDGEVMLALLHHLGSSPQDGGATTAPPPDWQVNGVTVDPEQRGRVTQDAADQGYVETTIVERFPVPVALTEAGRRYVRDTAS